MSPLRLRALAALLAAVAAAPAAAAPLTYDQRQEGEFNVRADVQNVVLLAVIPGKALSADPLLLLSGLKSAERRADRTAALADVDLEPDADADLLQAFAEPPAPYRVDIAPAAAAAAEPEAALVVVPVEGDRYALSSRDEEAAAAEAAGAAEEPLKLLGAREQCGPGRARDAEGVCRAV